MHCSKGDSEMNFEQIGVHVPTILLPAKNVDLAKWAVVACDQYTSQPDYWENVKTFIGDSPSTLNLILPEVYLESEHREQMIKDINRTMDAYLDRGILVEQNPGFILIDRENAHGVSRRGLLVALDLEQYDYSADAQTLIRATEGTILDRLPPRIQVRQNASLETPHIMVLIDDPEKTVIEPLFTKNLRKVYDADLMMNGGHIQGYMIDDESLIRDIAACLARLADQEAFNRKYSVSQKNIFLYAMGDGNHSFATAKAIWENLKKAAPDKALIMNHPARYALVELVNIHDTGLDFEPIHRVVFNVEPQDLIDAMQSFYVKQGSEFSCRHYRTKEEMDRDMQQQKRENTHLIAFVTEKQYGLAIITNPRVTLEAETLQSFLDEYMQKKKSARIDYIHGAAVVTELGSKPGAIGFYLPAISKHALFKSIILDGALPRKTFSMGEADDKRFYLECRKITV